MAQAIRTAGLDLTDSEVGIEDDNVGPPLELPEHLLSFLTESETPTAIETANFWRNYLAEPVVENVDARLKGVGEDLETVQPLLEGLTDEMIDGILSDLTGRSVLSNSLSVNEQVKVNVL